MTTNVSSESNVMAPPNWTPKRTISTLGQTNPESRTGAGRLRMDNRAGHHEMTETNNTRPSQSAKGHPKTTTTATRRRSLTEQKLGTRWLVRGSSDVGLTQQFQIDNVKHAKPHSPTEMVTNRQAFVQHCIELSHYFV
jgi:hypothetical protein